MTRLLLTVVAACLLAATTEAQQPAGLHFEITVPDGKTVWRLGERVPITMRFWASTPNRWTADSRTQDRIGRLNFTEEFFVEPSEAVRDPLTGLGGQSGGMGGLSGGPHELGVEPYEIERDLNEWIEFSRPGTYRVTVVSRRVSPIFAASKTDRMRVSNSRSAAVELSSNTLTLHIVEATPAWASARLNQAIVMLNETSRDSGSDPSRRLAGRTLRFLRTEQAAREMVLRLGSGHDTPIYDFRHGILSSPHRAAILPYMEQRLVAPGQPVNDMFIHTLTTLATLVREPPQTPLPAAGPEREVALEERRRRAERTERRRAGYFDRLAVALSSKTPSAAAVASASLSAFAKRQQPRPAWHSQVVQGVRDTFRSLPFNEQRDLLTHRWHEIAGPEMIPVLEGLYRRPLPDAPNRDVLNLAVRRLYDLDPSSTRQLIVEEIRMPTIGVDLKTKLRLNDETLPELYEWFNAHLWPGSYGADELILRFGDGSFVELALGALRIREQQFGAAGQASCVSALHFYVLKHARQQGIEAFRRAFRASAIEKPGCLAFGQKVKGAHAWSPGLELVLGTLPASAPAVAIRSATSLLGRYGSADAEDHLWSRLEQFHQRWAGRAEEMVDGGPLGPTQLERELRIALARGSGWVLDDDGWARLRRLCVSDWCRIDVDQWRAEVERQISVSISSVGPERFSANVGGYHARSRDELFTKLRQFPAGANLRWNTRPRANNSAPAEVMELVHEIEAIRPGLH